MSCGIKRVMGHWVDELRERERERERERDIYIYIYIKYIASIIRWIRYPSFGLYRSLILLEDIPYL